MTEEKQAELIAAACEAEGLDAHIKWIERRAEAHTWAERIAERFRNDRRLPVKNSYMYCDTLDMCFFYDTQGVAYMTYAGYTTVNSSDIVHDGLFEAFRRAKRVLERMKELAEEAENGGK